MTFKRKFILKLSDKTHINLISGQAKDQEEKKESFLKKMFLNVNHKMTFEQWPDHCVVQQHMGSFTSNVGNFLGIIDQLTTPYGHLCKRLFSSLSACRTRGASKNRDLSEAGDHTVLHFTSERLSPRFLPQNQIKFLSVKKFYFRLTVFCLASDN